MTTDHFDAAAAATYDADSGNDGPEDIDPVIDVIARLAGAGRALEFAVGTGRIAIPLARRGVPVHGIEYSQAMLDVMAAKPGADRVPCTVGDMASTRIGGRFQVVYLVFNTIMNLTSQAAQVDCFANAAAHLATGGSFVVEVMVPRPPPPGSGSRLDAWEIDAEHWGVDEYDPASQRLVSHHLFARPEGLERRSTPFRYVWPAELDLMARLAGLSLAHRWSDWHGNLFTHSSRSHVSIWQRN